MAGSGQVGLADASTDEGADVVLHHSLSLCPPSGFRGERAAGPHRGQAEHFHWDPLLDGPRGHRLR